MLRALLLATLLALPMFAQAQMIGGTDAERLERLEKRLVTLEGRAFSGGGSGALAGSALADMEQRMQDLEREGSQINGGVERLSNAVERLAKRVDELAKDFDLRLRDLEAAAQANGVGSGQVLTPKADLPPTEPTTNTTASTEPSPAEAAKAEATPVNPKTQVGIPDDIKPEEHYNRAYAYLTAADYPNAQAWLEEFTKRHPKNELADNAYYWLGEVHLVQNNPKAALVNFKSGMEAFPKGQKAPANLLKMGVALQQLNQPDLAKGMWQKLVKDYPKSPEAEKARAKLAELPKDTKKK